MTTQTARGGQERGRGYLPVAPSQPTRHHIIPANFLIEDKNIFTDILMSTLSSLTFPFQYDFDSSTGMDLALWQPFWGGTVVLKMISITTRMAMDTFFLRWSSMMAKMISIDSGMVVVIFISLMYMVLVFGLLFYVKNDWCDLLFKNFTVCDFHFETTTSSHPTTKSWA